MKIHFSEEALAALRKAGVKSPAFQKKDTWHGLNVESGTISVDFDVIKEVLKKPALWADIENRRTHKKLEAIEEVNAAGPSAKIKSLEVLAEAIKKAIKKSPRKWVFLNVEPWSVMLPSFVTGVRYYPPENSGENYKPARTSLSFTHHERGENETGSVHFDQHDIVGGKTVAEILAARGVYAETEPCVSDYDRDLAFYHAHCKKTGEQYTGIGMALSFEESRWNRDAVSLVKEGEPARLVMDDGEEREHEQPAISTSKFWSGGNDDDDDDGPPEEGEVSHPIPIHPLVLLFNLSLHQYVVCHAANLTPYKYDDTLREKLVLPKDHKELIDALTTGAVTRMDDIIKGKAVGVIVLCSGKPGTGKTLTAEVYSEVAHRPLYTIQCSQLGTNEEALEKNLAEVLTRATRWRAILLIDEADVYIHERGADIRQNAIVGVFLRLLEYYKGILFLTTNRETVTDDAIISRVTAHVRYNVTETPEDTHCLWAILAKQYGIEPTTKFLHGAAKAFPGISGRSIRQLIRLAKIVCASRGKKDVEVADLEWAASYHDFTERE